MTHPLSEELRDFSRNFRLRTHGEVSNAFERAADALDATNVQLLEETGRLRRLATELKNKSLLAGRERDELRRRLEEAEAYAKHQKKQSDGWFTTGHEMVKGLTARAERAEAQAARYKGALEWYADSETYNGHHYPHTIKPDDTIDFDDGRRARQALREPETKETP